MGKSFCLKCGKEIENNKLWHDKCIHHFFNCNKIPEIFLDTKKLKTYAITQMDNKNGIAGVQEKLSLHLDVTNKKRPRLTLIDYPTGYILKPQSSTYKRLPEFEHTAMLLAELCGIDVVEHGLIYINKDELAYITKRIDRCNEEKIHMEDFCQASGNITENKYRSSYEECIELITRYSRLPFLDKIKLFQCIYFSFVIGNSDLHLKNFSFIMDRKGKLTLSPFYDLLPTKVILTSDHEDLGMLLNNKKMNLNKKDFDTFCDKIKLLPITKEKIMKEINSKYESMCEIIDNSLLDQNSKTVWKKMIKINIRRAGK